MEIVNKKSFQIEVIPPFEFTLVDFFYSLQNELKGEYDINFNKNKCITMFPFDKNFSTPLIIKAKREIENGDIFLIQFETWEDDNFDDDIDKIFNKLNYLFRNLILTELT